MKITAPLYIAALSLAAAGNLPAQSSVKQFSTDVVISPSQETRKPMITLSSASGFEQIFPGIDATSKNARRPDIASVSIGSNGQQKRNLSMFRSVKVYLAMDDGSNQVLIAGNPGITNNAGSSLDLNLNRIAVDNKTIMLDQNQNLTVEQAILGRVSGVEVSGSGEIRIRGINSTGGGTPLFVIDGIERNGISGLNPGDVSSVTVLKNASELAIYGVRGANGVISVRTRSGTNSSAEKKGSMDNFAKGSKMLIRVEYVLRAPLTTETTMNVKISYK